MARGGGWTRGSGHNRCGCSTSEWERRAWVMRRYHGAEGRARAALCTAPRTDVARLDGMHRASTAKVGRHGAGGPLSVTSTCAPARAGGGGPTRGGQWGLFQTASPPPPQPPPMSATTRCRHGQGVTTPPGGPAAAKRGDGRRVSVAEVSTANLPGDVRCRSLAPACGTLPRWLLQAHCVHTSPRGRAI